MCREGKAGLEIIRSRTQIKPVLSKNDLKIKIKIWDVGNLDCQMSPEELTKPEMLKSLARRNATAVQNEIYSAVEKAQELNADIFWFWGPNPSFFPPKMADPERSMGSNISPSLGRSQREMC
jgi:spore germination protein KC